MSSPKKPFPPVRVQLSTTGRGYRSISSDMIEEERRVRTKKPTTESERISLHQEWERIREKQKELESKWPEDTPIPGVMIPTVRAIDWSEQPSIPAEQIDWSKQGAPLRVRPTIATFVTAISLAISILGGGAYFYWGVKTHMDNLLIHIPKDGIPWGVKISYETRNESSQNRKELVNVIHKKIESANSQLKQDLIQVLNPRKRRRYRR